MPFEYRSAQLALIPECWLAERSVMISAKHTGLCLAEKPFAVQYLCCLLHLHAPVRSLMSSRQFFALQPPPETAPPSPQRYTWVLLRLPNTGESAGEATNNTPRRTLWYLHLISVSISMPNLHIAKYWDTSNALDTLNAGLIVFMAFIVI